MPATCVLSHSCRQVVPRVGHGRWAGRLSQRWVCQAVARMRRGDSGVGEGDGASITRAGRSVQAASFLKPRVCQEWVDSMTQRLPAWRGKPFWLITARQPSSARSRILVLW